MHTSNQKQLHTRQFKTSNNTHETNCVLMISYFAICSLRSRNRHFLVSHRLLESSWNVTAHGDARVVKWRGNWRMEWVASTLQATLEHGISSVTTADAHTSAASSRLNWRPRRLKWTRPFRLKTKFGFSACAITFQTQSTSEGFHVSCDTYSSEYWFSYTVVVFKTCLTLNPLTWRIRWAPNNARKWQMGFNSAFKGLIQKRRCRFCEKKGPPRISSTV